MKGIEFRLEKTTSQIEAILLKPTLKLTLDIFYINFTKFCTQALQIAQNIISHTVSQKHVPILFQKLCNKLKQAKKYKPEHQQQQDDYHVQEKDQITEFLNARRPIKDNKNLTQLNWYVEHMEKKQKDTEIFVQCMAKMKKNQTSKKVKTDSIYTQTQIRWVNNLQVNPGSIIGLTNETLFQSIPQFKQYMDKQAQQYKNIKQQYKDLTKKYLEMKQIQDQKINQIEEQVQVKPKLANIKAGNKKKKSSISNNIKKNTLGKQSRNSGHNKENLSGFCTPENGVVGSQAVGSQCKVQNNENKDKNHDNVKEIDYDQELSLIKENSKRRASRNWPEQLSKQNLKLDIKQGKESRSNSIQRRRSSFSSQATIDNKKASQSFTTNCKDIANHYRQVPLPTKISQQSSQFQTQSPRIQSGHKRSRSNLPQNSTPTLIYPNLNLNQSQPQQDSTITQTQQLLKSPFEKKPLQKTSFTYRDQAKSKPAFTKQQKQNIKNERASIRNNINIENTKNKVHTIHRESQISNKYSKGLALLDISKSKQKDRQNRRQTKQNKNIEKNTEHASYHQQKIKIASVTANRFHSKLKNFTNKQSFQNLPNIHNKVKMITHQSQSDQISQKQPFILSLGGQDQQYLDYINISPHNPHTTYQQSQLQKKDTIIYNKITQLQSSPKQNQIKIQQYLNAVIKMHKKLCGKECKHLLRFYKQVHRNNWNNRVAIQLPTRKFGFFT